MSHQNNWRELDVFRDAKYENLVTRFCSSKSSEKSSEVVFKTIKEFMVFSALVGFELSFYEPINKGVKKISIALGTYQTTNHDAYIYLIALSKTPDLEVLKAANMNEAIKAFEGYCNGGLRHINDWVLSNIENNLGSDTLFKNTFEFLVINKGAE